MYPEEPLKYPSCGRALSRIPFLIGDRQVLGLEAFPYAPFEGRIHHQTQRHHHKQGHDPLLALQKEGPRHKLRVLQEAEAAFDSDLTFVAPQHLFRGKLLFVEFIGRYNEQAFLLQEPGLSPF
jgi:hypothetical protein